MADFDKIRNTLIALSGNLEQEVLIFVAQSINHNIGTYNVLEPKKDDVLLHYTHYTLCSSITTLL